MTDTKELAEQIVLDINVLPVAIAKIEYVTKVLTDFAARIEAPWQTKYDNLRLTAEAYEGQINEIQKICLENDIEPEKQTISQAVEQALKHAEAEALKRGIEAGLDAASSYSDSYFLRPTVDDVLAALAPAAEVRPATEPLGPDSIRGPILCDSCHKLAYGEPPAAEVKPTGH